MSPRKSSTSSGRPKHRPRYLGIEVAGEPIPALTPRWWETTLRSALLRAPEAAGDASFRLVRSEGPRAIAEVDGRRVAAARAAWNAPVDGSPRLALATRRTWGTLLGAKRWLRPMRADRRAGGRTGPA